MFLRKVAFLLLLVACGGGRANAPAGDAASGSVAAAVALPDTSYPEARRGAMTARAALPGPFVEVWHPKAGVCTAPPSVQLQALGDSVDVMMVLRLAAGGPATGRYTVTEPEDSTFAPGTARMAVQVVSYLDRALRATRGSVELSRLDRFLSGRFNVLLEGFSSPDTVPLLGVFDRIRVDSLPEPQCRPWPANLPPGVQ